MSTFTVVLKLTFENKETEEHTIHLISDKVNCSNVNVVNCHEYNRAVDDSDAHSHSDDESDISEEDEEVTQTPLKYDTNHATIYTFECNSLLKKKTQLRYFSDANFAKASKKIVNHLESINPKLFKTIRRGDLFENTSESGHDINGRYIFDVQYPEIGVRNVTLQKLSDNSDDCAIPANFKPIVEFPLDYWNDNSMICLSFDDSTSDSCWCCEMPEMTVDPQFRKELLDSFTLNKCVKKIPEELSKYGFEKDCILDAAIQSACVYYPYEYNDIIYLFRISGNAHISDMFQYVNLDTDVWMHNKTDLKEYITPVCIVEIKQHLL